MLSLKRGIKYTNDKEIYGFFYTMVIVLVIKLPEALGNGKK